MSGAGKTTVLDVLTGRGLATIDTDYGDGVLPDETWDEPRMHQLLVDHRDIVVAGTVPKGWIYEDPNPRHTAAKDCQEQLSATPLRCTSPWRPLARLNSPSVTEAGLAHARV